MPGQRELKCPTCSSRFESAELWPDSLLSSISTALRAAAPGLKALAALSAPPEAGEAAAPAAAPRAAVAASQKTHPRPPPVAHPPSDSDSDFVMEERPAPARAAPRPATGGGKGAAKPPAADDTPPPGQARCPVCSRPFPEKHLPAHVNACLDSNSKPAAAAAPVAAPKPRSAVPSRPPPKLVLHGISLTTLRGYLSDWELLHSGEKLKAVDLDVAKKRWSQFVAACHVEDTRAACDGGCADYRAAAKQTLKAERERLKAAACSVPLFSAAAQAAPALAPTARRGEGAAAAPPGAGAPDSAKRARRSSIPT